MTKATALKIVNPLLGLLLLNQMLTGMLRKMLSREAFQFLHGVGGMVFAAVVLLHVILNWNWIKANYLRRGPAEA